MLWLYMYKMMLLLSHAQAKDNTDLMNVLISVPRSVLSEALLRQIISAAGEILACLPIVYHHLH